MHESIHIKLEYPEAVQSKRSMLEVEKSMLEIVKHMRTYDSLKKREFTIKTSLKKDFEELVRLISAIENHIPREETGFSKEKYKKEIKVKEIKKRLQSKINEQRRDEIEDQIQDIQAKLAQLG